MLDKMQTELFRTEHTQPGNVTFWPRRRLHDDSVWSARQDVQLFYNKHHKIVTSAKTCSPRIVD